MMAGRNNRIALICQPLAAALLLTAGNAVVSANVLENTVIKVDDQTGANLPIHLQANVLRNSEIVHRKGNLIKTSGQPEK